MTRLRTFHFVAFRLLPTTIYHYVLLLLLLLNPFLPFLLTISKVTNGRRDAINFGKVAFPSSLYLVALLILFATIKHAKLID